MQEIDGKYVLLIWVPAGVNRPYNVRERVTASNQSPCKWYVRSGTNTIEARGEVLDELREMANRTPFDERGNESIEIQIFQEPWFWITCKQSTVVWLLISKSCPCSSCCRKWTCW